MLDYATVEYPFTEFPKGIDLTLFDKNGKKTFVKSNFAVSYKINDIIDFRKSNHFKRKWRNARNRTIVLRPKK